MKLTVFFKDGSTIVRNNSLHGYEKSKDGAANYLNIRKEMPLMVPDGKGGNIPQWVFTDLINNEAFIRLEMAPNDDAEEPKVPRGTSRRGKARP